MENEMFELVLLLLIVGVVLFFFPIDGTIKNIILCIIVVMVILTLAHGAGMTPRWKW